MSSPRGMYTIMVTSSRYLSLYARAITHSAGRVIETSCRSFTVSVSAVSSTWCYEHTTWREIYVPLVKVSERRVNCSRVAGLKRWISPPILTRRCFAWQNWLRRSATRPSLLNCGKKRSAYVISSTPPGGSRKRVSMVISTHRQKPYLHRTRRCEPKCRYGSLEILLNWSIVKLFLNALLNSISIVEKPWDRNVPGS